MLYLTVVMIYSIVLMTTAPYEEKEEEEDAGKINYRCS